MAVASQIYEKFRAGETGWAENRSPFNWVGGFYTFTFAGVPTKNSYEEGILFPEYAEIFQNVTSGREVLEFRTGEMRRGIHAWTVSRRIIAEIWVAFSQNLSDNLGDRRLQLLRGDRADQEADHQAREG